MKTDKSTKFAVTTEQEYLKMGQEHTSKDREITRQEIIEIEEKLNGHNRAWVQIWGSGIDHNHQQRIINSKVTHSENVADLYLMYKDHKKGDKTRPTATGHSSDSLGLSNSVAEVLEAVANSEKDRYNTISSEDMLYRIHQYNKDVTEKRKTWLENKTRKLLCIKCKIMESVDCPRTEDHGWDLIQNTNNNQEQTQITQKITNNNCCGLEIEKMLENDCTECGPGVNKLKIEFCVFGNDVKALYPSIQSEKSGKIIRERVEKSTLEFEGFCPLKGLAYIAMNRSLTSEIDKIEHIIPTRKSTNKKELKMSAVPINWDPETRFNFPKKDLNKEETRLVLARVVEVATRTLFENHMYRFGDVVYRQESGGSIGDRWTGSAAELIMQDWSEQYRKILVNSGLTVLLLAGYVDDGRQGTTALPLGMEFDKSENKFCYRQDVEQDDKTRRAEGESDNQRMARKCIKAMNSINSNLEFTVECQEEFENERLPTLDFSIWQEEGGILNHSYFQKPTKTPFVIMARSGASVQQKIQILSNELARRLGNVNKNNTNQQELNKIVEQLTQELKNSEYSQQTAREIVVSGLRCWQTRLRRKEIKGQEIYRPAHKTLRKRTYKKLMERETWYKEQEKEELPEMTFKKPQTKTSLKTHPRPPRGSPSPGTHPQDENKSQSKIKAVMFVPFTPGSELAKMLRENEEKLVQLTNNKLKIVERASVKLQDIITKSNPWKGTDCQRSNCLLCFTKTKQEKPNLQDCHKRSLVYETWCITCENMEFDKIEELELGEQQKNEMKRKVKKYKYVGETGRSAFERGWEHLNDLAQLRTSSHMLKHCVGVHEDKDMGDIVFGMKVIQYSKSSFERQIRESVQIQAERKDHYLLNSRTEYNRNSLPRLCAQIGDGEYKKVEKEIQEEKKIEEGLEYKIRQLRKEKNKARLRPTKESGPSQKRRKINSTEYININDIWGEPENSVQEKRKETPENENNREKRLRASSPMPPRGPPSPGTPDSRRTTPTKESTSTQSEREPVQEKMWEDKIREHKENIIREQQEQIATVEQENRKENSWELYRLCKEFLEENSQEWEIRRKERIKERERQERVSVAKNKTRKAQMKLLRKNVEAGVQRLTTKDREQLEQEEKKKLRTEIQNTKQDLWKLRKKERTSEISSSLKEIRTLTEKAEKVKELLRQEKLRVQEQKEREQTEKDIKRTKEQQRKERLEKQKKLQDKWAMYRWITEYIDENSATWEKEKQERIENENKKIAEWEKMNRFEKIKEIKRKQQEKKNETAKKKSPEPETSKVWRTIPKKLANPPPPPPLPPSSPTPKEPPPENSPKPIEAKINPTRLAKIFEHKTKEKQETQNPKTLEKPKITQKKEASKTSTKKPKISEKSIKQMQGFWLKYAEKSRERKRIDTITNNLDGVAKNDGLQSLESDNPNYQISTVDGESSCQVTQGNPVQISVVINKPENKTILEREITHRFQNEQD